MGVGEVDEVPKCLNERVESDAIYIYGVSKEQIPKIK